ncbi:VanZ family protein [Novispirillum sp. DQ9]|uniref:VanZ family protein n=1 Tax=Novispirillum sp. DQ9 TaxID=3398612 RepID=UPI003C7A55C8
MKEFLRAMAGRAAPVRTGLWWISLIAVIALSITPDMGPPERFGLDKAAHFAAYAWLGLLTSVSLRGRVLGASLAALLCTAIGTEVVQVVVEGRSAGMGDVAANLCGLAAGMALGRAWARRGGGRLLPRHAATPREASERGRGSFG